MSWNWISIQASGAKNETNSFVLNLVMWLIYPQILSTRAFVREPWHPVPSDHVSASWLVNDVVYSSLCKGWNMRKRVFLNSGWSMNVHFLSGVVVLGVEQGPLCGQKNNADPFAPLSSKERLLPIKEAKSVDSVSPTTSPRTANNWDDWEKRALWSWALLPRGFH